MKLATLPTPEQNSIFKYTTMGPMIQKEMKYNLHYGNVRGDVLPPPHGTKASCISKINAKRITCTTVSHCKIMVPIYLLQKCFEADVIFFYQGTVSAIKFRKHLTKLKITIALRKKFSSTGFITAVKVTKI